MAGSGRLTELSDIVLDAAARALSSSTPVLVALSGGADSAVAAWAVRQITGESRAAHVHHGWPASDRMEQAARATAEKLEMDLQVRRVNTYGSSPLEVLALLARNRTLSKMRESSSREARARYARYRALSEMRRDDELVVTGHTQTDQAETVLGNLMWGTGIDGLRGIHARRGYLIRPLLGVTRSQTRELATLLGLPFVDDPANQDQTFRRVRIRRALYELERSLGVNFTARLVDLAEVAAADLQYLEEQAGVVSIEKTGGAVRIPRGVLRTLPAALAARVVRRALRELYNGSPGTRDDTEKVLAVARTGVSSQVTGSYRVQVAGAYIHIGTPAPLPASPPLTWDLDNLALWGSWTWQAVRSGKPPAAIPSSPWRQAFDLAVFGSRPATIRSVASEDHISIGTGHKAATVCLAEARIPPYQRASWPVLATDQTVLWIPGVRRANAGWITEGTAECLVVSAEHKEKWASIRY